jgi:flavin-dependent dehydrogenase
VRTSGINAWWGRLEPNYQDYLFHPVGHGLNLSRPDFDSTLAENCRAAGVGVMTGARLLRTTPTHGGWQAVVQDGDRVRTYRPQVMVDATGRAAVFARSQGASIEARDSQVALIAFCASDPPIERTSARVVIESAEHGWWYFAPLRGSRAVCMLMTDADLLTTRPQAARATWEERLRDTEQMRECLRAYPLLTRMVVRTARSQRLGRMAGRGWIAVGDAAIAFDPLSSQGIAKGLAHGRLTADAVLTYFNGEELALAGLGARFAAEFADYEQTRLGYYALERRWPHAPFWRRRHTTP